MPGDFIERQDLAPQLGHLKLLPFPRPQLFEDAHLPIGFDQDLPPTLDFCRRVVRTVCERYGGDGSAVFLTGFSRGAAASPTERQGH